MKIGIMCHSSFGGSGHIAVKLAAELARRSHRVHLFTRSIPRYTWNLDGRVILHTVFTSYEEHCHPAELCTEWSALDVKRMVYEVLKVINREGLDLLHFHYALPFAFIGAEVKNRLEDTAPLLVGTLHGTDVSSYGLDPLKTSSLAGALRSFNCLTTVSANHARLAERVFNLSSPPEVIPNFVDLSRYRPRENRGKDRLQTAGKIRKSDEAKVVHISNFRPVKDIRTTIRIFAGILKRVDAELWLVGDGQEMKNTKSFVRQEGIEDHVRFWGFRDDVNDILGQADLLLMSSLTESFCLAALEAMACGVPVLATDVGGLPEVVVHGKTGFLFPRGNCSLAVDFAVKLLSDPAMYNTTARAAAKRALQFGQEQVVSRYERFYQREIDGLVKNHQCAHGRE